MAVKTVASAIKNTGNQTLQEKLLNAATDATLSQLGIKKEVLTSLTDVLKKSGNKTLEEALLDAATDAALGQFGGNKEVIKSLASFLKNSGNKTLEETLLDAATKATLGQFGDNEVIKSIANAIKNPGNKTLQENILSTASDVALSQFEDNEAVKSIVKALKNSGNKTLEESLLNAATEAALSEFGDNEAVKNIAILLKNSGNKTLQENLLNVAAEAALSKYGDNEAVKGIVGMLKNQGNKTLQENLLSFAANAAKSKFGNNAIVQSMVKVLEGNGTIQEKLSAATESALNTALGPVGAAVAKQGINMVGNVLKIGGGWFGGLLSKLGGNSTLGNIGQAITGGSHAVGGFMNSVAGNKVAIATVPNPIIGLNASAEQTTKVSKTPAVETSLEAIHGGTNPIDNNVAELSKSDNLSNQILVSLDKGNIVKSAGKSLSTTYLANENKSENDYKEQSLFKETTASDVIHKSAYENNNISKNLFENKIDQPIQEESFLQNGEGKNYVSGIQTNATATFSKQGQLAEEGISLSNIIGSNTALSNRQQVYQGGYSDPSLQAGGTTTSNNALETALESLRTSQDSLKGTYGSTGSYGMYGGNNNIYNRISSAGADQGGSGQLGNSMGSVMSIEITTVKIQMG